MSSRDGSWTEREIRAVLLAALAESGPERRPELRAAWAPDRPLGQLLERAGHHKIVPALRLWLKGLPLRPADGKTLNTSYFNAGRNQLAAALDLATVADSLDGAGLPWLLVKGPVVAEMLYAQPEQRTFVDLDVLVEAAHFTASVSALEAAGAQVLDTDWPQLIAEMRGQLHLLMPHGTAVDLHWHLLNRDLVRRSFAVSTHDATASSRRVVVEGRSVRTLDPTRTLLHLCLHAALSGGNRLSWLKDIDRAVVVGRPDWDDVAATARSWRARLAVGGLLARTRTTLGTDVPAGTLRALIPPQWRPALAALDRAAPVAAEDGRVSPLSVLTPTLRDQGVGPSPRIVRAMPPAVRRRLEGAGPEATAEGDQAAGRTAYLHAVAAAADPRP